jgi:hypothetical protein
VLTQLKESSVLDEISSLPKDAFLFQHGQFICYAIHEAEQYPNLINEIYCESSAAFKEYGYADAAFPFTKAAKYSYRVILWDCENDRVVSGYKITLATEAVKQFGWGSLAISTSFYNLDELLERDAPVVLLEASFVAPKFQRKGMALLLTWRGVTQLINTLKTQCHFLGRISTPYQKYSPVVQALYVSCLRNGLYFSQSMCEVKAYLPCDEKSILSTRLLEASKEERNLSEIERFITKETGVNFKLPILLHKYTKHFPSEILGFGYDEHMGSLDILQVAQYSKDAKVEILKKKSVSAC